MDESLHPSPFAFQVALIVRSLEDHGGTRTCGQCKRVMARSGRSICDPCRAKAKRYNAAKRIAKKGGITIIEATGS